jgi:hypothetical protein
MRMEYYVVQPDGSKFGPASLELLNKWAETGRVLPDTVIERVSDGAKGPASLLPGLVLPADAPPPVLTSPPSSTASASQTPPISSAPGPAAASQARETATSSSFNGGAPATTSSAAPPHAQTAGPFTIAQEEAMLSKFNWGACLLIWVWGFAHRAYWTLLAAAPFAIFILVGILNGIAHYYGGFDSYVVPPPALKFLIWAYPVAWVALRGWFGLRGNAWAWRSGRFLTPKECQKTQRIWSLWGAGVAAAGLLAFFTFRLMLPTILDRQMGGYRDPSQPWLGRQGTPFGQGFPNSSSPSDDPGMAQMRKDMERIDEQSRKQMEEIWRRDRQATEDMQNRMRADMAKARGNVNRGGPPGR